MTKNLPEKRAPVTIRYPVPLVRRVEAARKACAPRPTSQAFYTYLVERGLKDVEAPK